MSHTDRVFITGLSSLTACGNSIEETWQAIIAGKTGIAPVEQWQLSEWDACLGGELKQFHPAKMLADKKLLKVISPQDAMGLFAATQAVNHSGIASYRDTLEHPEHFNDSTAIYVGSPGNKYFQQYDFVSLIAKTNGNMVDFAEQLFNEVHPMWLLRILPNNVLAYIGIAFNFKGTNHNVTNHAVGGVQALIEAFHAIKSGQAERAVVVAYDMGIEPQGLFYYDNLGVISGDDLKPFDKQHNGTILANGAAALVLESASSVSARSAPCYAELLGGYSSTEGTHIFSVNEQGKPLRDLINKTLTDLKLTPSDISFITAHGNGNEQSDNSEAIAINDIFNQTPITAFKWATGHTLCASGLIDTVLTVKALEEQCIPGIANFTEPALLCEALNINAHTAQLKPEHSHLALIINRGFAAMNACVVIKSCE